MSEDKPEPEMVEDEHGVLVWVEGSDMTPAEYVRSEMPRRCWEHPRGVVVTRKEGA